MNSNVFCEDYEINRLEIQSKLLKDKEDAIYEDVLKEYECANILDIGCNDGKKLVSRFSSLNINKGIGVDCDENLIKLAEKNYGNMIFSFKCCDVEADDFENTLELILRENNIQGFHVICISYVLLHLKNVRKFLKQLKRFLVSEGKLIIVEPLDSETFVGENNKEKFLKFIHILNKDPLAGNRKLVEKLDFVLMEQGYKTEKTFPVIIQANGNENVKKREIFEVFFSYLPKDIDLQRKKNPENEFYTKSEKWINNNYEQFRKDVVLGNEKIRIGICIKIASPIEDFPNIIFLEEESGFYLEKLNYSTVEKAKQLCDLCVGRDLYSIEDISSILCASDKWYYLLKNKNGEAAGYIYFCLTDLDFLSRFTRISREFYEDAFRNSSPVVGDLRSGGILPQYRNKKLSTKMYAQAIKYLSQKSSDVIIGVCWKYHGKVPVKKTLETLGMSYLTYSYKIWYNHPKLYCPVCKDKCTCDAEIYYKILEGEK